MSSDSKTAEIRAPAWLDRAGKRMFRQVVRQLPEPERPLSDAQTDLISDYVEARQRIAALGSLLDYQVKGKHPFQVPTNITMQLVRQIDSTTALSLKIADRLGLTSGDQQWKNSTM